LIFGVVASAVAVGLVVFDRKAWLGHATAETKTQLRAVLVATRRLAPGLEKSLLRGRRRDTKRAAPS
jgi:hypothetical protein